MIKMQRGAKPDCPRGLHGLDVLPVPRVAEKQPEVEKRW